MLHSARLTPSESRFRVLNSTPDCFPRTEGPGLAGLEELKADPRCQRIMRRRSGCRLVLSFTTFAFAAPAQVERPAGGAPAFEAQQVLYGARQVPLAPDLGLSIYGRNLGP